MDSKEDSFNTVFYNSFNTYENSEDEVSFVDTPITLLFPKGKKIIVGKNVLLKFEYFKAIFELESDIKEISLNDDKKEVFILIDYMYGNKQRSLGKNINSIFKLICKWGFSDNKNKLYVDWDTIRFLQVERKEYISVLKFPNELWGVKWVKLPNIIFEHMKENIENMYKPNGEFKVFKNEKYTVMILNSIVASCKSDFSSFSLEEIETFCKSLITLTSRLLGTFSYYGDKELFYKFSPKKISTIKESGNRIEASFYIFDNEVLY